MYSILWLLCVLCALNVTVKYQAGFYLVKTFFYLPYPKSCPEAKGKKSRIYYPFVGSGTKTIPSICINQMYNKNNTTKRSKIHKNKIKPLQKIYYSIFICFPFPILHYVVWIFLLSDKKLMKMCLVLYILSWWFSFFFWGGSKRMFLTHFCLLSFPIHINFRILWIFGERKLLVCFCLEKFAIKMSSIHWNLTYSNEFYNKNQYAQQEIFQLNISTALFVQLPWNLIIKIMYCRSMCKNKFDIY